MAHIVLSKEDMNKLTNLYLGLDFKYNVEVKLTKTYDEYKIFGHTWSTNEEDEGLHLKFDDVNPIEKLLEIHHSYGDC